MSDSGLPYYIQFLEYFKNEYYNAGTRDFASIKEAMAAFPTIKWQEPDDDDDGDVILWGY